jgi:UDP-3-O-[3-hydroxymyristoyl] glucosamine N-acyltransferase
MSFEAAFDTQERVRGFHPSGSDQADAVIEPHRIGEYLDGGERVTVEGQEFNLTERGNLIACAVEMPQHLTIGYGVYVGSGVEFVNERRQGEVTLGSRSRIGTTEPLKIGTDVEIGKGAIVATRAIRRTTEAASTYAASNATLEEVAQIGNLVYIGPEAEIGLGVHIGALGRISSQAVVARTAPLWNRMLA